jgi:hypothetical protein
LLSGRSRAQGFPFLATWFLLANWLMLNMIIGVIMENYELIKGADALDLSDDDIAKYMECWEETTAGASLGAQRCCGGAPVANLTRAGAAGRDRLPAKDLQGLFDKLGQPLGTPELSKVEINDWFSSILHELERKYKMSYEDQKLGYSFRQVLETLVVLFAGASALSFLRPVRCGCTGWGRGPHSASRSLGGVNGAEAALSYEEKQELAKKQAVDQAAKIVIGSLRMWLVSRGKQQGDMDPETQQIVARSALEIRMKLLTSRVRAPAR